jgi:hypothetical protein
MHDIACISYNAVFSLKTALLKKKRFFPVKNTIFNQFGSIHPHMPSGMAGPGAFCQ